MTKRIAGYTESECMALRYAFSSPHGAMAAPVNRCGGAFRRVVERMAKAGLLTAKPPFRLTVAGHRAHVEIRRAMDAASGCIAYMMHRREAEDALKAAESACRADPDIVEEYRLKGVGCQAPGAIVLRRLPSNDVTPFVVHFRNDQDTERMGRPCYYYGDYCRDETDARRAFAAKCNRYDPNGALRIR